MNDTEDEYDDFDDESEPDHQFLVIANYERAVHQTVLRRQGNSFRVRYSIAGTRREIDTCDDELAALCAWLADRADNATLIVTPLP